MALKLVMMRTNTACTLYRKTIVSREEVWTGEIISAVMWENRKAANVIRSGLLEADAVTIYIPLASVEEDPQPGDIFVRGAVLDIISSGFTITDLEAKYADVVKVTSVDRKDFGSAALQHWQIGAK